MDLNHGVLLVGSELQQQHDAAEQDWGGLSQQEDAQQLLHLFLLPVAVHAGDNGMVVHWKEKARDSGALVPFVKHLENYFKVKKGND